MEDTLKTFEDKTRRRWKYHGMVTRVNACWDCGQKYNDKDGWVECTVPHDIWELINPSTDKGGGLLCIACIVRRLAFLGLENVPVQIHNTTILVEESIADKKIRERKELIGNL